MPAITSTNLKEENVPKLIPIANLEIKQDIVNSFIEENSNKFVEMQERKITGKNFSINEI